MTYGFDSYLTFNKKVTKSDNKKEISGSLKAGIEFISADFSGNIAEKKEQLATNLDYEFFGNADIIPPTTFTEAIELMKEIPDLAKNSNQVVSFTISPVQQYCTASRRILNAISSQNIKAISKMFLEFESTNRHINTLKESRVATEFNKYGQILAELGSRYNNYKLDVQSKLKDLLPKIRVSSSANETSLEEILKNYNDSPFEFTR